jgi:hypothetical protein
MARPDSTNVPAAFQPHLLPGEQLQHYAYGVKQPPILLIVVFMCLAILPGIIATAVLTKHYLIGLTDKRFLVLEIKSMGNQAVKSVLEYPLQGLAQMKVKASTGALFTHIKIDDAAKPFVAKFHRMGMKTNREHCLAIEGVLNGTKQLAA